MTGAELWRRKSDQDVLDAVSLFHEYTEEGQAILRDEMRRRGLAFPAAFASSCLNCGAQRAAHAAVCDACGAATVSAASAGLADEATAPNGVDPSLTHPSSTCPTCGRLSPPGTSTCACGHVLRVPFFEVATQKFVVMSICTLGAYSLYWFYENWKRRINDANGRVGAARNLVALSAFLRAFFAPLWAYALFRDVRDAARAAGLEVRWRPWVLAVGYIVTNLFYRLPNQAAMLSLAGVLFLVPVQQAMQRVNQVRGGVGGGNARYGLGNIACIVLGASFLLVALLSPFLAVPK